MNSKTVSSWMLIVAPILFVLVLFVAWPAVIGEGETSAESVALMLDNPTLAGIFTMIGTIVFGSLALGYALLAWSRADGSTTEGTLASLAAMIFVGMATMIFIGLGTTYPIIGEGAENLEEAEWIFAVGDSMFAAVFLAWTLGNVVLGAALLIENKINRIASGLVLLAGILMVILHLLVGIGDSLEVIWIVPFFLTQISAVVLGIFNLRSES